MAVPLAKPTSPLKGTLLSGGQTWIERHMAERGLTVTALALKLGISRKHLSNILNGAVPVSDEMIERIAKPLGIDPVLLGRARHDRVVVTKSLAEIPPSRITIIGDIHEPIENWFADDEG